jgi:hypothetical protein
VSFGLLLSNMEATTNSLSEIFSSSFERKFGAFELTEVEVSLEVSADGKVGFMGSGVGMKGTGSMKLKFERHVVARGASRRRSRAAVRDAASMNDDQGYWLESRAVGHVFSMAEKHRYTPKEHRQAEHIKASEEARGRSAGEAEAIGYATVNKQHPGKHRYTAKERRQAQHIIDSEEDRGKSEAESKRIAYATVNKQNS